MALKYERFVSVSVLSNSIYVNGKLNQTWNMKPTEKNLFNFVSFHFIVVEQQEFNIKEK